MRDERTNVEVRDELYSLIIESMIGGILSIGRPRKKDISQIMKDAEATSYRELEDMANDSGK